MYTETHKNLNYLQVTFNRHKERDQLNSSSFQKKKNFLSHEFFCFLYNYLYKGGDNQLVLVGRAPDTSYLRNVS